MSDIGLCLTGILLVGAMLLTTGVYAVIASISGAIAALRGSDQDSLWAIAGTSALLTLVSAAALVAMLFYMDRSDCGDRPVWIDLLAVPWLFAFPVGLYRIFRSRPPPEEPAS